MQQHALISCCPTSVCHPMNPSLLYTTCVDAHLCCCVETFSQDDKRTFLIFSFTFSVDNSPCIASSNPLCDWTNCRLKPKCQAATGWPRYPIICSLAASATVINNLPCVHGAADSSYCSLWDTVASTGSEKDRERE